MPNKNSKKTALKKAIKIALGCCFSLFASDSLLAQDSDPNLQDVEVVTVKGQKRDTLLQNADVAVTVFTSEYIENSRIRGLRRIDDLLPNVQFNQSGQTSSVFATIRGIESSQDIVNRAGLYIDGIPFRELNNSVLDQIESIEVLRGPQSTLYGANTEAGLFIVTSRKPQDYFEADIRLTNSYFNDENAYGVSSFIGGPIIDQQLKGSIVLNYSKEDAFLQNPFAPNISTAEIRESFVQGNLIYTPNDTLTVRSTFYIIETDAPGLYESEFVPLDKSAFDDNIFFNPFTQTVEGSFRELFHEGRNIGDFEFFSDVPKQTNEQDIVFGLGIEQALDFGSLDLAFSYAKLDEDSTGLDTDISAFRFQSGFAADFKETWSGEATFTSLDSDRFEYLFGISWYKEDRSFTRDISFFNPITNDYDGFGNVPELFAFAEDYAIFGSTTFGLGLDGLFGTIGLRYDYAKRESSQEGYEIAFGLQTITFLDVAGESDFKEWLPRFAVRYEANDVLTLFTNVAKGYIPGGFNLAASADPSVANDILIYDKESVWSYEIGFKYSFMENKGFLNASAFLIESDGWQEFDILTNEDGVLVTPSFISSNANIKNQGFEVELTYQLTDALQIQANLGYTDAVYKDTEFTVGGRGQVGEVEDLDGVPVKLVPEYDFNLAGNYEFGRGFYMRLEANLTGETPLEFRSRELDLQADRAVQKSVTRYNAYLGYEADYYAVKLFAENITNRRVASGLAFPNLTFGFDGTFYAPIDPPRVVGVELEIVY